MLPRAVGFLFTRFRQRQFREYVQIMTSYTPLKQEPHTRCVHVATDGLFLVFDSKIPGL
jgi:hypothetical protein